MYGLSGTSSDTKLNMPNPLRNTATQTTPLRSRTMPPTPSSVLRLTNLFMRPYKYFPTIFSTKLRAIIWNQVILIYAR